MEYRGPQRQFYVRLYANLYPDSHRISRIELVPFEFYSNLLLDNEECMAFGFSHYSTPQ